MAASAPTFIQPLANDRTGLGKIVVVDVTLDSAYADGGEAIDLRQLSISEAWFVAIEQKLPQGADHAIKYQYDWDYTNNKVVVSGPGVAGTNNAGGLFEEVATSTDLSTVTIRLFVYGLGA